MEDLSSRRAVITGCGALSPLGCDVAAFWDGLLAGRSGLGPIRSFDTTGYTNLQGGEVKAFGAAQHFSEVDAHRLDRTIQYALVAAREALQDAALDLAQLDRTRV